MREARKKQNRTWAAKKIVRRWSRRREGNKKKLKMNGKGMRREREPGERHQRTTELCKDPPVSGGKRGVLGWSSVPTETCEPSTPGRQSAG